MKKSLAGSLNDAASLGKPAATAKAGQPPSPALHRVQRRGDGSTLACLTAGYGLRIALAVALLGSDVCMAQDQQTGKRPESAIYNIPNEYRVGQVSADHGTLALQKSASAFQFSMPDGKPLAHDFALEGLPDVSETETSYPVVVNSISYDPPDRVYIPERQMANLISNFSGNGVVIKGNMFFSTITFIDKPPNFFTFYYVILNSVAQSGRISGFLRCFYFDKPQDMPPSSCDGWEYAEDLNLVMRIRFPRNKIAAFSEIGAEAIALLQSWKTK